MRTDIFNFCKIVRSGEMQGGCDGFISENMRDRPLPQTYCRFALSNWWIVSALMSRNKVQICTSHPLWIYLGRWQSLMRCTLQHQLLHLIVVKKRGWTLTVQVNNYRCKPVSTHTSTDVKNIRVSKLYPALCCPQGRVPISDSQQVLLLCTIIHRTMKLFRALRIKFVVVFAALSWRQTSR